MQEPICMPLHLVRAKYLADLFHIYMHPSYSISLPLDHDASHVGKSRRITRVGNVFN